MHQGQVYRALSQEALAVWRRVSAEPFYQKLVSQGLVIGSAELNADQFQSLTIQGPWVAVLHHDRIPFVTYPYEWSFSMLQDAALLHLQILTESVRAGTILKDSSPYNVQYLGSRPVFIDIGSFVELSPGEPWAGYRQFCEMMLFPLLLQSYRQIDIQSTLRSNLEGISSRQFLKPLSWRDLFRRGVFTHGWVQSLLEKPAGSADQDTRVALKASGFDRSLIENNLAGLTRLVRRLSWKHGQTQWTGYRHELPHVVRDAQAKSAFVAGICAARHRSLVWDLGCNDGHFSRIAAEHADTVIAMDQDHACVERLYRELAAQRAQTIVPLCINLLNPSPAQGWRGRERSRLETRGLPDLVLCLGLIHHLVIAGNIPLPEVVDWLASLRAEIILEFPSKRDLMVQALLRNKQDQYDDYSLAALEDAFLQSGLRIVNRTSLPSGERTLLHAVPNTSPAGAA